MHSSLKQQLIHKNSANENEALLNMLKEDIDVYEKTFVEDDFSELSAKDKKDLMELIKQPFGTNCTSHKKFKTAMERWRIA